MLSVAGLLLACTASMVQHQRYREIKDVDGMEPHLMVTSPHLIMAIAVAVKH